MGLVAAHLQPWKLDGVSAGPSPVSAVPSLMTNLMIDLVASWRGGGIAIIQSITKEDTTKEAGSTDDSARPLVEPRTPSGSGAAWRAFYLRPTDSSFEA
jgi:hypothetical protein